MSPEYVGIICFVIGLAFIVGAYREFHLSKHLRKNGVDVEGIIFQTESGPTSFNASSGNADSNPTIRFVTKEGDWITKEYRIGLPWPFIKPGQKVHVKYDALNPEEFIIVSPAFNVATHIFLWVGIVLFGFGLYKIIEFIL